MQAQQRNGDAHGRTITAALAADKKYAGGFGFRATDGRGNSTEFHDGGAAPAAADAMPTRRFAFGS
jgi:hypothetical protein